MLVLAALSGGQPMCAPLFAQRDMTGKSGMLPNGASLPLGLRLSRLGSGTSWLPDSSADPSFHADAGAWMLMVHGAASGQYDHQTTVHGGSQLGVSDWEMVTALRQVTTGLLSVTVGTSLETLIDGPRGYPEILQTGGAYQDARIANREHPHPALMQLGAAYDRTLVQGLAWSAYGAAVGEPAIGPVAYMHRPSAADDPFAPLAHHWEDATHDEAGVATLGLYSRRAKLEGSAFNARESDDGSNLPDYVGARLDSYSGRISVATSGRVMLSAWAGYLFDHDPLDPGTGMQRYGASVLTSLAGPDGGQWSSALVWGLDVHHHGGREHVHDPGAVGPVHHLGASALLESTLDVGRRISVFGRLEQVQKTADDLGFLGGDLAQSFTIREASGGIACDVVTAPRARIGVGLRGTVNLLPEALHVAYGTRTPVGGAIFVSLKPR